MSNRIKNTKRNIVFSFTDSIITIIFEFVSKSLIVYYFGNQYLGLTGLFSSILQVLIVAELGFSMAIIYNMYKPIAENDVKTVCSLLNYYKQIYRRVALVVFLLGICITPFLPYFIKDEYPQDINIYILFIIYLINTVFSYLFFSYRTALLNAAQRLDLTKIAYLISNIIQYGLQIFCLIVIRNYYLYVVIIILGTINKNILAAVISKREFPHFICEGKLAQSIKKDIIERVKGVLICNISGITYTTFDNIIISTYLGLVSVTKYNNYLTIYNGVMLFVVLVRTAMQASVGNSVVTENKEKNYNDMCLFQFGFSFLATWCTVCMLSIYQPFMKLWMGEKLLLPIHDVLLICLWFYFSVVQNSVFLYLSGKGFWWEMRWPYILSTVTNIIMNIILGKILGVTGIIVSTIFSSLIFCQFWQCGIIFKKYFKKSMINYQKRQGIYFLVCLIVCVLTYEVNSIVGVDGILGMIVKLIICTIISFFVQFLLYFKTKDFKELIDLIIKVVKEK